jgi:hypothetical protein
VEGPLEHPSAATTRTKATALAREGDEALGVAAVAAKPGEALREHSAADEALELALDETRQTLTVAPGRGVFEERQEMLAHHTMDHGSFRNTGLVAKPPVRICMPGVQAVSRNRR